MSFNISSQKLRAALSSGTAMVIVDVRDPSEYLTGHIDGAVNWPLENLGEHLDAHSPNGCLIFTCKSGQRSLQACNFAKMLGFTDIKSLTGGYLAWSR